MSLGLPGKLRGRSFTELRERAAQLLRIRLERAGVVGDQKEPTDAELARQLAPAFRNVAIGPHLIARNIPALAAARGGHAVVRLRSEEMRAARDALMLAADRILSGKYDLLGYEGLSFGDPIDWRLDPVSGRRAPAVHWSSVPFLDAEEIGDHKVTWELNRHQQFMVLGRAWQVSGRADYAACFASLVVAWMDANPPKTGVNWASSLEVAYRSIAWIWALELFRGAPDLTPDIAARMLKFLVVSARHLEQNLSTYFSPNTHLTGEALGLLYIGAMFPELAESRRWAQLGWTILEREASKQILPDGVYFEQASYYQRYTVDIFVHAAVVGRAVGLAPSPEFRTRVIAAARHLASLMRADGSIPLTGDDDGGRLVALETRAPNDVRSAIVCASLVLNEPILPASQSDFRSEEALWLIGDALPVLVPESGTTVFPDGGYVVMKSGSGASEMHAVFDRGPLGAMNCGHAHADALSLVVSVGGCPVLVDPGTFTYTTSPEARRHFRHSAAHNTVTIDGESSSEPGGPFTWASRADTAAGVSLEGRECEMFSGSTPGFRRLPDPVDHERFVSFVRGEYWVIRDVINSALEHTACAHFHLPPGALVAKRAPGVFEVSLSCVDGVRRVTFLVAGDVDTVEIDEDWVSPAYGARSLAPRLKVIGRGAGRREMVVVISPDGQSSLGTAAGAGRGIVVNRPSSEDLHLFGSGKDSHGVEVSPAMAFVRRQTDGGHVMVVEET